MVAEQARSEPANHMVRIAMFEGNFYERKFNLNFLGRPDNVAYSQCSILVDE